VAGLVELDSGLRNQQCPFWWPSVHPDPDDPARNEETFRVWKFRAHNHGVGVGLDLDVEKVGEAGVTINGPVRQFDMNGQPGLTVTAGAGTAPWAAAAPQ
jgi:hypothetical protein